MNQVGTRSFWRSWRGLLLIAVFSVFLPHIALTKDWPLMIWVLGFSLFVIFVLRFSSQKPIFQKEVNPWMVFCVGTGSVVIAIFSFVPERITSFTVKPEESLHWGALIWTYLLFIYWIPRLHENAKPNLRGILIVVLLVAVSVGAIAYSVSPHKASANTKLLIPLIITALFVFFDVAVIANAESSERHRRDAAISLVITDIPTIIALAWTLLYVWVSTDVVRPEGLNSLALGVISFQMVVSKVAFIMVEAGALDDLLGRQYALSSGPPTLPTPAAQTNTASSTASA